MKLQISAHLFIKHTIGKNHPMKHPFSSHCSRIIATLFLLALGSPLFAVPLVPVEDFFKDPDYGGMALSPDGSKLAVVARTKERLSLAIIDTKTKQSKLLVTPKDFDVAGIFWVGSNRILFRGITAGDKFLSKTFNGALYAVDADGKNFKTLCESNQQQLARSGGYSIYQANVMGRYGDSTDDILISYNGRAQRDPDVYRINVHTGSKRMVVMNPDFITGYLADHTGAVRVGVGVKDKDIYIIYRDSDKDEWREVRRWQFGNDEGEMKSITPLAFDKDNRLLYVAVLHGDAQTRAIALYDPKTDTIVKELFANDTYDIGNVLLDGQTHELNGYYYNGERGAEMIWTTKKYADWMAMMDEELPGMKNLPASSSDDDTWILINSSSDRDPGTYYMFNSKEMTPRLSD